MNLWRVPIDESTGATVGPPEALSAPTSSAALMSMSADGRAIAYTALTSNQSIERIAFDPGNGSIGGAPVTVIAGSRPFVRPYPSPDGQWLTFQSLAPQLDIFVSRSDGTGMRQLTNDRANDRNPTWSPDGKQIVFMSNRDGMNQIWSIKPDGSGLRRLTSPKTGASTFNRWSPDGSKIAYDGAVPPDDSTTFVFDPRVNWPDQKVTSFSKVLEPGRTFTPWSWSPDWREVAGAVAPVVGGTAGPIFIYSFATGKYTRVYDSEQADGPLWLNDGRRLLVQDGSRILLLDLVTRKTRELMSVAPATMELWSITRDNRTVYFDRHVDQSDIWLMRFK
jgi:WD40 repeat protein